MIEVLEFLLVFLDAIIQIVFAFGLEKRADAYGQPLFRYPLWNYLGLAILGGCVGWLISQLLPQRLLPPTSMRGIGLIVSPLIGGLVMKLFGRWRTKKEHQPTVLATFWGGAAFAFGTAFIRWLMVGRAG